MDHTFGKARGKKYTYRNFVSQSVDGLKFSNEVMLKTQIKNSHL